MRYIPHTEEDIRQMLEAVGVDSVKELFATVPDSVRLQRPLNLPSALSETELVKELKRLAAANATCETHLSFLGGGEPAFHPCGSRSSYLAQRILHRLHPLPAGD